MVTKKELTNRENGSALSGSTASNGVIAGSALGGAMAMTNTPPFNDPHVAPYVMGAAAIGMSFGVVLRVTNR